MGTKASDHDSFVRWHWPGREGKKRVDGRGRVGRGTGGKRVGDIRWRGNTPPLQRSQLSRFALGRKFEFYHHAWCAPCANMHVWEIPGTTRQQASPVVLFISYFGMRRPVRLLTFWALAGGNSYCSRVGVAFCNSRVVRFFSMSHDQIPIE